MRRLLSSTKGVNLPPLSKLATVREQKTWRYNEGVGAGPPTKMAGEPERVQRMGPSPNFSPT